MITPERKQEFLNKLNLLLQEYNASIGFTCDDGSDTHGLSGDGIVIDMKEEGKDERVLEVSSWWMDHTDIPYKK